MTPQRSTINHQLPARSRQGLCHFTSRTWRHCERRLTISRSTMLIWKTRATRSARKPPAHPIWVFGFTISMAIAGSCQCKEESDLMSLLFPRQRRTCPPKPWRRRMNRFYRSLLRERSCLDKVDLLFASLVPFCLNVLVSIKRLAVPQEVPCAGGQPDTPCHAASRGFGEHTRPGCTARRLAGRCSSI